jgi:hypothetical protein
MKLDKWTQQGCGHAANYPCERDMKYGMAEWKVLAVVTPKQTRVQPHHHWQHLESFCRSLISSLDNHKCCKRLLAHKVVKWGWVSGNHSYTHATSLCGPSGHLICHRLCNWRLSNLEAVTAAYCVPCSVAYRVPIQINKWWQLQHRQRNSVANS